MFAEYEEVRTYNALKKDELLEIDASTSNQVCNTFGLHPSMPFLKELYDEGDLSFLANVGLLNELCDQTDYKVKTTMILGSHNTQRLDVLRVRIFSTSIDTAYEHKFGWIHHRLHLSTNDSYYFVSLFRRMTSLTSTQEKESAAACSIRYNKRVSRLMVLELE